MKFFLENCKKLPDIWFIWHSAVRHLNAFFADVSETRRACLDHVTRNAWATRKNDLLTEFRYLGLHEQSRIKAVSFLDLLLIALGRPWIITEGRKPVLCFFFLFQKGRDKSLYLLTLLRFQENEDSLIILGDLTSVSNMELPLCQI